MDNEMKFYEGDRKQFRTAMIIFSVTTFLSLDGDALLGLVIVMGFTAGLRYLNKRDHIAMENWGAIIGTFIVVMFGISIAATILTPISSNKFVNAIVLIIMFAVTAYGWIVYLLSKGLVEAAVDPKTAAVVEKIEAAKEAIEETAEEVQKVEEFIEAVEDEEEPQAVVSSFCTTCGTRIEEGHLFCHKCGTKVYKG